MSMIVDLGFVIPLFTGLAVSGLWHVRRSARASFLADRRRIEIATQKLREHSSAMDRFMFLPDAPEPLKAFLLDASDAFESRAFAQFMADRIRSRRRAASAESEIWPQVQGLYLKNEEAYDVFVQALFTGLTAALLRWPETCDVVAIPSAPTQDYIKQEVTDTARAIRARSDDDWHAALMPA
jgi:hypothetical protein